MKNKFTLGTRLSLVLNLAIASSLIANVAQAEESRQERQAQEELSLTITKLVDLGADQQWLVEAALGRATNARGRQQNNVSVDPFVDPISVRGRIPARSSESTQRR